MLQPKKMLYNMIQHDIITATSQIQLRPTT